MLFSDPHHYHLLSSVDAGSGGGGSGNVLIGTINSNVITIGRSGASTTTLASATTAVSGNLSVAQSLTVSRFLFFAHNVLSHRHCVF